MFEFVPYAFSLIIITVLALYEKPVENDKGVKDATPCEVCKCIANELQERIDLTGKVKETLKIGYNLMEDSTHRKQKYDTSELRYIEIMDGVCNKILEYNVHKERLGSLRYAKGQSETMSTLHGLKNRGVKVELGIPEELWDSPSAEVTEMKRQCDIFIERYEYLIEDWYYQNNHVPIINFLCRDPVLRSNETECLKEVWTGKEKVTYNEEKSNDNSFIGPKLPPINESPNVNRNEEL